MKYINKFNTTSDYKLVKSQLNELNHFIAYTTDTNILYLKPTPKIIIDLGGYSDNIVYFNEKIKTEDGFETVQIQLEPNITYISDAPYGFYISGGQDIGTGQYLIPIVSIKFNNFDTSNVIDMSSMFHSCTSLTSLNLNNFNTSNVTTMNSMFHSCTSLTSLNLNNFNTSNVTTMNSMFYNCSKLQTIKVSNFNTLKVSDMSFMFSFCKALTSLNLNNFTIQSTTNISYMFQYCSNLTSLYLSNFEASNVTTMTGLFAWCDKLTHIKCKQSFKDWCWTNQDTITLPTAMRDGGSGTWEIIDYQP